MSSDLTPPAALDDPYGGAPEPPRGRSWPWGPMLWAAVVLAWFSVDALRALVFFFHGDAFLYAWVWLGVIAVAACATIGLLGWEFSRRQWIKGACAIVLAAALSVGTFAPNWTSILAHGYYDLHRQQFAAIANSARASAPGCSDDTLPATSMSITGKTERLTSCPGPLGIYIPRGVGLLEGGAGYGWFSITPPDDSQYIINDDPGWTCWAVGNGWYWMENGNYPAPTMKGRASHC